MESWKPVLAGEQFISLETFRTSGEGVRTAVWFAEVPTGIYIVTMNGSGKVKRIRNNPEVRVAACSRMGEVHGNWFDGQAVVTEGAEEALGYELLNQKYNLLKFIGAATAPVPGRVILRVRLDRE